MMRRIEFRDLIELVGIISIVVSLIFVGLQFRQEHTLAQGSQFQARTEMALANYRIRLENIDVFALQSKIANEGVDSLTDIERRANTTILLLDILRDDNNYYQYELGLMSEDYLIGFLVRFNRRIANDDYRQRYKLGMQLMRPAFQQYFANIIDEFESSASKL